MSRMPILLRTIRDFMATTDHLENHSSLSRQTPSQTCGEELEQNSLRVDLMQDHSLPVEEDFSQTRGTEITLIIEIGVLQQLLTEMSQLRQEHHLLVDHRKDMLKEK